MKGNELAQLAAGAAVLFAIYKIATADEVCLCSGGVCLCGRRTPRRRR